MLHSIYVNGLLLYLIWIQKISLPGDLVLGITHQGFFIKKF